MTSPHRFPRKKIKGKPYPPKGDDHFHDIWRVVDGAILDTIKHHPNYFNTTMGVRAYNVRMSLNKRIVGALMSYEKRGKPDS